jgi:cytochrome c oxidase subunit III
MLDHPVDPSRFKFKSQRNSVIPNGVLGTLIFVFCEIMFFAGMISSHMITRANAVDGIWPPPGSPMLPALETGINTGFLILSGVLLFLGHRAMEHAPEKVRTYLIGAVAFGGLFVLLQGREWVGLLEAGLTFTGDAHGSFFYFIVGTHGLHAVAALGFMAYMILLERRDKLDAVTYWSAETFWYFVVGVWPLIFWQVYL